MSKKEVVYRGWRLAAGYQALEPAFTYDVRRFEIPGDVEGAQLSYPKGLRRPLALERPETFSWGEMNEGAKRLALAILCDHLHDPAQALFHHTEYAEAVIARLQEDEWEITADMIRDFFQTHAYPRERRESAAAPRV